MQLFVILALLLFGGKSGAQNILSEVKPVLESIGGEEMQQALKSAEEISSVLAAVQGLAKPAQNIFAEADKTVEVSPQPDFFPLAPIASIADKDITYSLSQYISQN